MKNPVLTAHNGTNAELFPEVLRIYAQPGSRILDMTYGNGVFWKKVEPIYCAEFNDLFNQKAEYREDFRSTSWPDGSFDVVVLDPPYMFGAGGKDSVMDTQYKNGKYRENDVYKGVAAIVQLYREGMTEARRILKHGGYLMVKCMDLIQGGKQHRIHFSLLDVAVKELGMVDEDLFVLVSNGNPIMRHSYQLHARKNNSFLWVFRKNSA
jgi:hypothetical protein